MQTAYDVVVAGGGIAGLYAARELSKAKLKVLLIDQGISLGSTAGTPIATIEKFSLPKEGINVSVNKVIIGTINKEKIWTSEENVGYILDYKRMGSLLLKQIQKNGAKILSNSKAVSLIKKDGRIEGIKTSKGDFYCRYLIDATGAAGVLISQVDLRKRVPCSPAVGIEYVIHDKSHYLKKYQDSMAIYFDTKLFPCGYGWIFCNGQDNYKVGVCEYMVHSSKNLPGLETRLKFFYTWLLKEKKVEIVENHGGSIYFGPKFEIKNIRYKNLLGIGDTIGSINPLLGEGVRHALYSADFAVKAILNNIKKGKDLKSYEKMWQEYIGFRWKLTTFVSIALYEKNSQITQIFYDQLLEFVGYLNMNDIIQIVKEYKLKVLLKKFPQNIGVIFAMLKARFLNFD